MVALAGGMVVEFTVPYFTSKVIGLATQSTTDSKSWDQVKMYGLILAIIVVGSSISTFFRGLIFQLASERIARQMRKDLYQAILS